MPGRGRLVRSGAGCRPERSPDRWPVFAVAAARLGVRAVFALPVTVAGFPVGVLTLCRHRPGRLTGGTATGVFLAAELGRAAPVGCDGHRHARRS